MYIQDLPHVPPLQNRRIHRFLKVDEFIPCHPREWWDDSQRVNEGNNGIILVKL